jgi:PAS domain S-box-containing protein
VVEELRDLLHIFDAEGRIKTVSPSAEHLTGYNPTELRDLLMRDLLHPDDVGVFTSELNQSIASGTPFRVFYRMKKKDGTYVVFEAIGHAHIAAAKFAPNPNNQTAFCQAVFMMARPYPTKNAALLDSFLEHKMENERLKRKIAELQKEEQDDAEESERTWRRSQETTPSESGVRFGTSPFQPVPDASVPTRERGASLEGGLVESLTASRRSSIGAMHTDTIEMLTGLRYQEGERSHGITTGVASPTLVSGDIGMLTGDAGIAIPMDRDQRSGDKKKKQKMAEEYVCTDCGRFICFRIRG